jgi:polysaccharide export outer membrane protein
MSTVRQRILGVFLLIGMTFVGPVFAVEEQGYQRVENYRISPGDLLMVDVYDEPDLSTEVRVLNDGYISLPLLGQVMAGGLTVLELEKAVTREYAEKYLVNPHITVFVEEFSRVFVFGEVQRPGAFSIARKMSVFEAITLAGGFTDVANKSSVKVIRQKPGGGETTFEVNVDRLTRRGDTTHDMELEANDRVIVTRSFF